jgi:hypothetical protein
MLYDLLIHTFEISDTELLRSHICEYHIEYLPSCEITIKSTILNATITIVTLNISILIAAAIISYHNVLYTIPSLFDYEKQTYIALHIRTIAIFILSVILTHNI